MQKEGHLFATKSFATQKCSIGSKTLTSYLQNTATYNSVGEMKGLSEASKEKLDTITEWL